MKTKIRAFARKTGVVLMTCLMLTSGIPNQLLAQAAEATAAAQQDTGADAATSEQTSHALTYDGNGATEGSMDPTVYGDDGGTTVKVADNQFKREGYTFTGWSTTATGEDLKDDDGKVSMRAVFIPAETELDNLAFSWDENDDGKVADDEHFDASDCERDNYLTLYAQWKQDAADENQDGAGTAAVVGSDDEEPLTQDDLKDAKMVDAPELTRDQLNALVDDPAAEPKASAEGDNPAGDGTSIDSLKAEWITESTPSGSNNPTLTVTPKNDDDQIVLMRLSASFSGQHDYNVGDIQFTVPKHVIKDRKDNNAGVMWLGVPEAPDKNAIFAYTDMGEYYVITNVRKLSAATSVFIEFSINDLTPHELDGNLDHYGPNGIQNQFYGKAEVVTYKGNVLTRSTETIDVQFDTSEEVAAATNKIKKLHEKWDDYDFPNELKPDNPSDYVYVDWYSWTSVKGNQDFAFSLQHSLTDEVGGIILGASIEGGKVVKGNSTNSLTIPLQDEGYIEEGLRLAEIHVYAAYPKENVPPGLDAHYPLEDEATYTLTPTDGEPVSTSSSVAKTVYSPMEFIDPVGHFNVFKEVDSQYPTALNKLREGQDIEAKYTVQSVAFMAPWTWPASAMGNRNESTKGSKHVTVVTDDYSTRFNHSDTDLTSDDFEFSAISMERPRTYEYKKFEEAGRGYLEASYGSSTAVAYGDIAAGEYGYAAVDDPKRIPDVEVWGKINDGEQELLGVVSWKSGAAELSQARDGVKLDTSSRAANVTFASNLGVTDITTKVTSNEGAVILYTHPTVRLKATKTVLKQVEDLFENSDSPETNLRNEVVTNVYETDNNNKLIVTCGPKAKDAKLQGVSTTVSAKKTVDVIENDASAREVKLRYKASVKWQTNITKEEHWKTATEDGTIAPDTLGTWYDLLPVGVVPDLSTIKLRELEDPDSKKEKDSILSVNLIEDYKGSGRTLMIVRTKLHPYVTYEKNKGDKGYWAEPSITFDATYSWDSMVDYGVDLNNVVAYESGSDQFGSVKGAMGEPNNPTVGNNVGSESAVRGVEELMTGLKAPGQDVPRTTNSFLYARAANKLAVPTSAVATLTKRVAANGSGNYKTGLGSDSVNVYEGGSYTYRLRFESDKETRSKDLVFYDKIDAYNPANYKDGDRQDNGDKTWRGTLISVDTSQMESAGADPVVYYNTRENLVLDSEENQDDLALTEENGWTKVKPDDASKITAVAIDASKAKDGGDFELVEGESVVATLRMKAPKASDLAAKANDGHDAKDWYDTEIGDDQKEGDDEGYLGGAHAYNNVSIRHAKISESEIGDPDVKLIHYDYTKVGLLPFSIQVHKKWEDDNNRDGKRPDSVTVALYADDVDTGKRVELSNGNEWSASFDVDGLTPVSEDGKQKIFTLREVGDDHGYTGYTWQQQTDQGFELLLTNYREPEKISVSGTKVWNDNGDAAGKRPTSVKLDLYADGELLRSKTIYAASQSDANEWNYTFKNLYKYSKDGQEIKYEVREETYYEGYGDPEIEGTKITNTYNPYGNLRIEKKVEKATEAAKAVDFSFNVKIRDKEGDLDTGAYAYTKSDGSTGTITSGGTLTLRAGEWAEIANIPSEYTYEVTEGDASGFTQTSVSGATGTIRAGKSRTAVASFINTYSASGRIFLTAEKQLSGRKLAPYQFKFELEDVDKGEIVRTASNAADGKVTFGALRYSLDDLREHHYIIREVEPAAGGYESWDKHEEHVTVTVADTKGNGELDVTASYTDRDSGSADDAVFNNEYHANGSINLRAWKTLTGRDLGDGEFSFKLTANDGAPLPEGAVDESVTVQNDANGIIDFPQIKFTEQDAGKTYTYTAEEVPGEDDTVTYSDQKITYTVKVVDNGDGTLSFDQDVSQEAVFKNTLKPGKLKIQKLVGANDGDWNNPNQEFTFHVQLTAKDGQALPEDGKYDYTLEKLDPSAVTESESEANAVEATADADGAAGDNAVATESDAVVEPDNEAAQAEAAPAAASDVTASGTLTGGNVPWTVYGDGRLVIGDGFDGVWRRTSENDMPWSKFNANITSVSFNGTIKITGNWATLNKMFYGMRALESVDLKGLAAQDATSADYMFGFCTKLTSISLSGFDASHVQDMSQMFAYCSALESFDLDGLDTSSATSMYGMFDGCSNLKSIHFPDTFDTSNVKDFTRMFSNCPALKTLDLSSFNTSSATNLSKMFWRCGALESVNISSFDTTNVTDMSDMFSACYALKRIDVSQFNTSNVTNMSEMFYSCKALESIDVSNFDTSSATNLYSMFSNCAALQSLDISNFVTTEKTSFSSIVSSCTNLRKIKLGPKIYSIQYIGLKDPTDLAYTGKWIPEGGGSAISSKELMSSWGPNGSPYTWVWEKDSAAYSVSYDANGGTGSMAQEKWHVGTAGTLAKNKFYNFGCDFSGWSTTPNGDVEYKDGAEIADDFGGTAKAGVPVTLYAVWTKQPTDVTIKDGGFDITLPANAAAVFDNLPANIGYIVTELTPAGWKIVDSTGTWGTIPVNDTATATFRNEYGTSMFMDAKIVATKTLDGQAPADGQFKFTLTPTGDTKGDVLTAFANAAGGVEFNLTGLESGKHTYKLSEVAGADDGIDYDESTHDVTVVVERNSDYNWQATVTYDGGSTPPTFKNTTKEKPEGKLTLKKVVQGQSEEAYKDKTFRFRVDWNGGLTHEFVELNSEKGFAWSKDKIPAGTTYSVTEYDIPDGYAQAGIENGSGTIGSGQTVNVTATNKYSAKGSAIVQAKKVLEGGVLASGQFTFGLFNAGDAAGATPIAKATNSAAGDVVFDAIDYTQAGTYNYEVREITGTDADITYAANVGKVTVTVTDDGNGHLSTKVAEDAKDPATFTNKVNPGELTITKHVVNAPSKGDKEFGFKLSLTKADGSSLTEACPYVVTDASGKQVSQDSVKDGGTIKLKDGQTAKVQVPLRVAYTVTEESVPGYTGAVTSGAPAGTIQSGEGQNVVEFTNTYESSGTFAVNATKKFTGGVLEDDQFTFRLTTIEAPGHEDEVGQEFTAKNDADGKIAFDGLRYSSADAGKTFVYELSEETGSESNIVYDKTKVTVRVTPQDNGDGTMTVKATYANSSAEGSAGSEVESGTSGWTFTNVRTFSLPETGQAGVIAAIVGGLALVAASGAWVVKRRRRRA